MKPEDLIREFRNDYYPRIAVTVDMIAAGTDIKPLEILLFMRLVKSPCCSANAGRTRVISPSDLGGYAGCYRERPLRYRRCGWCSGYAEI